jgi:hypothetical protein
MTITKPKYAFFACPLFFLSLLSKFPDGGFGAYL